MNIQPTAPLHKSNQVHEACPLQFAYLFPKNFENDHRRWVFGFIRQQKSLVYTCSLHNHSIPGPSKMSRMVKATIQQSACVNPQLKPSHIAQGKGIPFIPGVVDEASTHIGRISREVRKGRQMGTGGTSWEVSNFESVAEEIDSKDDKMASKLPAHTAKIRKNSQPYLISMGYENGINFIHTMSPQMSKLLSKAEFAEADITFNETYKYRYLFNLAVFDDTTMEWAVVSRVRMDKEGTKAHALAFKKTFQNCEDDHPEFNPGESLMGIVTDWSDAEISGSKEAIGKETATKVLRGCKIHWARSWQRARDRIACSRDKPHEKAVFSRIAVHISDIKGSHGHNVIMCFKAFCGDSPAASLVGTVKGFKSEDATFIDTHCNWSAARNWASWWLRSSHLQMLHIDFSPMVDKV